jgi:hypothetical protein
MLFYDMQVISAQLTIDSVHVFATAFRRTHRDVRAQVID